MLSSYGVLEADSLSARQTKGPQLSLGPFCLSGRKTAENPHGSTSPRKRAKNVAAKLQRPGVPAQPEGVRRKAPNNPSLSVRLHGLSASHHAQSPRYRLGISAQKCPAFKALVVRSPPRPRKQPPCSRHATSRPWGSSAHVPVRRRSGAGWLFPRPLSPCVRQKTKRLPLSGSGVSEFMLYLSSKRSLKSAVVMFI